MIIRGYPLAAALVGLLAVIGLMVSVAPSGIDGYVSEAGVAGSPNAQLYRLSVLAIAGSAALLAATLRRPYALAALALAVAAPAIGLSAAVSCTPGCPLPPYEPTTAADLVHAAGSLIGVAFCALAMLALLWRSHGRLRRLCLLAVATGWPLLIATAISILAIGRSPITGALERAGLTICLLWIVTTATTLTLPTPGSHSGPAPTSVRGSAPTATSGPESGFGPDAGSPDTAPISSPRSGSATSGLGPAPGAVSGPTGGSGSGNDPHLDPIPPTSDQQTGGSHVPGSGSKQRSTPRHQIG
jgi:hypothetical protein